MSRCRACPGRDYRSGWLYLFAIARIAFWPCAESRAAPRLSMTTWGSVAFPRASLITPVTRIRIIAICVRSVREGCRVSKVINLLFGASRAHRIKSPIELLQAKHSAGLMIRTASVSGESAYRARIASRVVRSAAVQPVRNRSIATARMLTPWQAHQRVCPEFRSIIRTRREVDTGRPECSQAAK
jgi:hypothetical protein